MVINSFQYYIFVLQIVTALTFFLTWFHECLLPFWKMCRENYFPPNSSWFNWYKMIFYCLFSSHSCFWTCQHTPCLLSCYPSLTSKSNWRLTARLPVPSAGIADLLWNFLKLIYSDFRVSLVLNSIECILNGKDQGSLQSQFYNLRLKFRNFSLSQNSEDWKITWMINVISKMILWNYGWPLSFSFFQKRTLKNINVWYSSVHDCIHMYSNLVRLYEFFTFYWFLYLMRKCSLFLRLHPQVMFCLTLNYLLNRIWRGEL